MRIAVAGFMHESNTFNPLRTDRAAFAAQSLTFGPAVADEWRPAHHEMGGFLEILDDLLLSFRVDVFRRRAKRQLARHPKFYLFDAGVFRALRPKGPLDRPEEIAGAALEGLVAQHLRAWVAYSDGEFELRTWRTRAALEVDFVVYGRGGFWALEVQNSRAIRPADLRGLRAFGDEYPESRRVLLYRGEDRLLERDVLCLPVDEFLRDLRPGEPLVAEA